MKKANVILAVLIGAVLSGCAYSHRSEPYAAEEKIVSETSTVKGSGEDISISEEDIHAGEVVSTKVSQGGPYGEISVSIPEGWEYKACPQDSEDLLNGKYGIQFYPVGVSEGFIQIAYTDFFGVCGTGLEQRSITVAGMPASMGIYDGHEYWDFLSFEDEYEGITVLSYCVDEWWSSYDGQVLEILDTLSFNKNVKEGSP